MNLLKKHIVTLGLLTAIGLAPLAAQAETGSDSGAGTLSAAAHLNLRVVIPRFLSFRVGTAGATIDRITFSPTAAVVGESSAVSGTGGDAAGSGASIRLRSNGGQVTITETNDGGGNGLNGTTTNISLAEISVSSDDLLLDTPVLSDGGGNTSSPTLTGGNVTNRSAIWTYAYNNTTVPDADTYDVEITYTASTP